MKIDAPFSVSNTSEARPGSILIYIEQNRIEYAVAVQKKGSKFIVPLSSESAWQYNALRFNRDCIILKEAPILVPRYLDYEGYQTKNPVRNGRILLSEEGSYLVVSIANGMESGEYGLDLSTFEMTHPHEMMMKLPRFFSFRGWDLIVDDPLSFPSGKRTLLSIRADDE